MPTPTPTPTEGLKVSPEVLKLHLEHPEPTATLTPTTPDNPLDVGGGIENLVGISCEYPSNEFPATWPEFEVSMSWTGEVKDGSLHVYIDHSEVAIPQEDLNISDFKTPKITKQVGLHTVSADAVLGLQLPSKPEGSLNYYQKSVSCDFNVQAFSIVSITPSVNVKQGEIGNVQVTIARSDYSGPVTISVRNLPPEVKLVNEEFKLMNDLTLRRSECTGTIRLLADPDAPVGDTTVTIVATGQLPTRHLDSGYDFAPWSKESSFDVHVVPRPIISACLPQPATMGDILTIHGTGLSTVDFVEFSLQGHKVKVPVIASSSSPQVYVPDPKSLVPINGRTQCLITALSGSIIGDTVPCDIVPKYVVQDLDLQLVGLTAGSTYENSPSFDGALDTGSGTDGWHVLTTSGKPVLRVIHENCDRAGSHGEDLWLANTKLAANGWVLDGITFDSGFYYPLGCWARWGRAHAEIVESPNPGSDSLRVHVHYGTDYGTSVGYSLSWQIRGPDGWPVEVRRL